MIKYRFTLKKCPFCGGRAHVLMDYLDSRRCYEAFSVCEICGSKGKVFETATEPAASTPEWQYIICEEAAKAWNRRILKRHD